MSNETVKVEDVPRPQFEGTSAIETSSICLFMFVNLRASLNILCSIFSMLSTISVFEYDNLIDSSNLLLQDMKTYLLIAAAKRNPP